MIYSTRSYLSFEDFLKKEGNITIKKFLKYWDKFCKHECGAYENCYMVDKNNNIPSQIYRMYHLKDICSHFDLDPEDMLDCTVSWSCGPGHLYWEKLDFKWQSFCDAIFYNDNIGYTYNNGTDFPIFNTFALTDFKDFYSPGINKKFKKKLI